MLSPPHIEPVQFRYKGMVHQAPKFIGILTVLRCIFGPNLEILTSISDELLCGQAQNGEYLNFLNSIWPWRSRSINPPNNMDLTQGFALFVQIWRF